MIQDYLMSASAFIFTVAAYRQVVYGYQKGAQGVSMFAAASTAALLLFYSVMYYTLGLRGAPAISCLTCSGWVIIAGQIVYYKRRSQ